MEEPINPIDQLFDPDDKDDIVLYDHKGKPKSFEQIAIIPLNKKVYAILRPKQTIPGVKDDEAFVYEVVENPESLNLVIYDKIIDEVMDEYHKLVKDQS